MSAYEWKHRELPFGGGTGAYWPVGATSPTTFALGGTGKQSTWTRGNLWGIGRKLQTSKYLSEEQRDNISKLDLGGAFYTFKNTYDESPGASQVFHLRGSDVLGRLVKYDGKLLAVAPPVYGAAVDRFPVKPSDQTAAMIGLGATAIANTIPTNPSAGVAQFLGELREGLPSVPGRHLVGSEKGLGGKFSDEYLNLSFGLKPMVKDLRDIAHAVSDSNRILSQLERDSGRLVRRRYRFPDTVTETTIKSGTATPYPPTSTFLYTKLTGPYTHVRKTVTRTWFSGAYTYVYQQSGTLWDNLRQAEQKGNRLLGARLTPELLWELAPWSWAVDWVTNIGDVVTNLSAFSRDGLVLRWGYLMQETVIEDTHTLVCYPNGYGERTLVQKFGTHVKHRIKATPYGFGLDPDWKDLSSFQLSILAALGMSRVA